MPPAALVAIAWLLAIGAVALSRYRGDWEAYRALHGWFAAQGVPSWIRNFDSLIIFCAAALAGAAIAGAFQSGAFQSGTSLSGTTPSGTASASRSRGDSPLARLGLRIGRKGWARMVLVALLPMVLGGAVLGWSRGSHDASTSHIVSRLASGVVRAPIGEELLFRGLLVGVCAVAIGWRCRKFWLNAAAASLLFAAVHVPWTAKGFTDGWPTLLMTGAGGLWYAWLLARWSSLWVPMILHAGMNLGWFLAAATGGAGGGGLIENLLRIATIAIATCWTIRHARRQTGYAAASAHQA